MGTQIPRTLTEILNMLLLYVIFDRDNVRNQVMNDETLDFVNFDDYKRLEPNPPLLSLYLL